jgi:multiple antibiotic resistance protein
VTAIGAFLLAFPALFSIVNPLGMAFIFDEVAAGLRPAERARLAGRIGFYSLLVILGAMWGGGYLLSFFGISLAALRVAGGTVVALSSWDLLNAPERQEQHRHEQADQSDRDVRDMAFFPLTMPFTTGPGTISVAITLGAARPASGHGLLGFFIGATAAAVAMALLVWIAYRSAGRVSALLGASGRRNISRLFAFLLLCVGVQILISGIEDIAATIMATGPSPGG